MDASKHDEIRDMFLDTASDFGNAMNIDPRLIYRIMLEAGHRGLAISISLSNSLPRLPDNGTTVSAGQ